MKRACQTILNKAQSWRGVALWGTLVDLHGAKVLVAACLQRMRLMVARIRPIRPAIALCDMPSRASANISCLISIVVGRGFIRKTVIIEKKDAIVYSNLSQCEGRFGKKMTYAAVLHFDDPTWHWSRSLAKVRLDFVGEQSQILFMSISANQKQKYFIA